MVLLKKWKHTRHYIKKVRKTTQQAGRAWNRCGSPRSTHPVRHMYTSVESLKFDPILGRDPTPSKEEKGEGGKKKKLLPSLQQSRHFKAASLGGSSVDFDLRLQCTFFFPLGKQCEEGGGHNQKIDQRMVRLGCAACALALSLVVCTCIAVHLSKGSTSQRVGQRLLGPLDHAGVELGVAPSVLGEVVAAHEALLAQWAAELLLPRVGPVVAGQLV